MVRLKKIILFFGVHHYLLSCTLLVLPLAALALYGELFYSVQPTEMKEDSS